MNILISHNAFSTSLVQNTAIIKAQVVTLEFELVFPNNKTHPLVRTQNKIHSFIFLHK